MRAQLSFPNSGSALGYQEARYQSPHEGTQNLFLLPPFPCKKALRKIGCGGWAQISGSQALSSWLIYLSSPPCTLATTL